MNYISLFDIFVIMNNKDAELDEVKNSEPETPNNTDIPHIPPQAQGVGVFFLSTIVDRK